MFIATYDRSTEFKKYLISKLNMIKSCLIDKRVVISNDTFTTNICLAVNALPYSIDQMNDVMFFIENNPNITIMNIDLKFTFP